MLVFNPEWPKISRALKETLLSNNTWLFTHLKTEPSSTFPHIINDVTYPTILSSGHTPSVCDPQSKMSASHSETNTSQTEEGERKSTPLLILSASASHSSPPSHTRPQTSTAFYLHAQTQSIGKCRDKWIFVNPLKWRWC